METYIQVFHLIVEFAGLTGTFLASGYAAWRSFHNGVQNTANAQSLHEVHLSLNSRLDEFIALTKTSSFAAGEKSAQQPK
jgi:hypothetical protein